MHCLDTCAYYALAPAALVLAWPFPTCLVHSHPVLWLADFSLAGRRAALRGKEAYCGVTKFVCPN